MISALHLLLLSFILLLVRPTTGTTDEHYKMSASMAASDYAEICDHYDEESDMPSMNLATIQELLDQVIKRNPKESKKPKDPKPYDIFKKDDFFDKLDHFKRDAEKFEALKYKISEKSDLIESSRQPYREMDNAIRADLIALVAKSERRARETAFLAREIFDKDNEKHQGYQLRDLRKYHQEFEKRIRENAKIEETYKDLHIARIVKEGYTDIKRYCDMAKQVRTIGYFFKKADIRGRGDSEALDAFKRISCYNEGIYEEGDYAAAAEKAGYGGKYGAARHALEKFKSMRTRDDHESVAESRKHAITTGALDKLMLTCQAEVKDKTITGYASALMNLKDEEVKTAATNLENAANTIKTIWETQPAEAEGFLWADPDTDKEKLQKNTMKILDESNAVANIGKAYEALRDMPEKTRPADADKMLTDIGAVAKTIREFVEEYDEYHYPLIDLFEAAIAENESKTKAHIATMTGSSAAAQAKAKAHRARHNKGRRNRRRRQRARK